MRIDCGPCVIRPYQPGDTAAIASEANNRKVAANLRDLFPHPYTEADAERWVAFATTEDPMRNFAIEADGVYAGGIGLKLQSDIDRISQLERIYATPVAANLSSARVLEKAFFNKECVMRRAAVKDGVVIDLPLYARLRGESGRT